MTDPALVERVREILYGWWRVEVVGTLDEDLATLCEEYARGQAIDAASGLAVHALLTEARRELDAAREREGRLRAALKMVALNGSDTFGMWSWCDDGWLCEHPECVQGRAALATPDTQAAPPTPVRHLRCLACEKLRVLAVSRPIPHERTDDCYFYIEE